MKVHGAELEDLMALVPWAVRGHLGYEVVQRADALREKV